MASVMTLNQLQLCPCCNNEMHVAPWHYVPSRAREFGPVCPSCDQRATLEGPVRLPLILSFMACLLCASALMRWLSPLIPYPVQSDLWPVLITMGTGLAGLLLGAALFTAIASRMARWRRALQS